MSTRSNPADDTDVESVVTGKIFAVLGRALLGSVAEEVARRWARPVLVVRASPPVRK